jgi:hypothetical protein
MLVDSLCILYYTGKQKTGRHKTSEAYIFIDYNKLNSLEKKMTIKSA